MNSGLQDAFNLAWKLAHVCEGHCRDTLLDSYEAERRPVAEKNARTGEEFERAQDLTDPHERRERNEALKAAFNDPTTRYHESIAEAELDFNYATSPIVMGDLHHALGPGHRLPHSIRISQQTSDTRHLHELTHRAGHTALLLGGAPTKSDHFAELAETLTRHPGKLLIEEVMSLTMPDDPVRSLVGSPHAAPHEPGDDEITLLVIRPDGHIGLRAEREHSKRLTEYIDLLIGTRSS